MSGLPEITGTGTLTGDPEIKMLPSGAALVTVNIAFNERKFNKEAQRYEDGDSTYLRGTIWRQYAENVAESLVRGDKVFVRGVLKQRSYEKDGVNHKVFELAIDEIGPLLRFNTATVNRTRNANSATPVAAAAGWSASSDEPAW